MLKTSRILKARMDSRTKRIVTDLLHTLGKASQRSIPMDDIQSLLVKQGYTLLQEDNTPWSGMISLPFETNVPLNLPIGSLNGQTPEPNTQFPPTGDYLHMSLYRHQNGAIEVVAYLS